MNFCMCGAEAGYPHDDYCPRPLFRGTDAQIEAWEREYNVNRHVALHLGYFDKCDKEPCVSARQLQAREVRP